MNVALLCNSFLALPSAQYLIEQHSLAGLATSARNKILGQQLEILAQKHQVPFAAIPSQHLTESLTRWIDRSAPDVVIVQTFPHRIPAECLNLPPMGFYNLHPSPLPWYKGPDPLFWQICNNEKESAVTLHKMEETFDTGPIFHTERIPIDPSDTYGLVQSNLSFAAVAALERFLSCPTPETNLTAQEKGTGNFQSKAGPEHLVIDWENMSAANIQALVRACNPHQNGAITFFRNVLTRLLEVHIEPLERVPRLAPGSVIGGDDTRGLLVLTSDEQALALSILHVEEGYFSGKQFCKIFEVGLGEKFCNPGFLS